MPDDLSAFLIWEHKFLYVCTISVQMWEMFSLPDGP